jgi:trigger factor
MEREVKNRLYSKNRDTVFAWLGEQIKVTLPESLVKADMRQLHQEFVERMKSQMGGQKISPSQFAHLPPELFRDKAQERVRLGLALRHIEDTQKLEPQSTAIEEEIQSRASLYDKPEEFIEWVKKDARQMEELKSFVLEKALVEWIFSQVSENKKELSFKELLANQTAST